MPTACEIDNPDTKKSFFEIVDENGQFKQLKNLII